jgi:hypothetical protein
MIGPDQDAHMTKSTRRRPRILGGGRAAALLFSLLSAAAGRSAAQTTYYVGATVIDGISETPIADATIVVADGKIQRIGSGRSGVPSGGTVVDLGGRYG